MPTVQSKTRLIFKTGLVVFAGCKLHLKLKTQLIFKTGLVVFAGCKLRLKLTCSRAPVLKVLTHSSVCRVLFSGTFNGSLSCLTWACLFIKSQILARTSSSIIRHCARSPVCRSSTGAEDVVSAVAVLTTCGKANERGV